MSDDAYREYLRSERWTSIRLEALERAEHRCQVCNSERGLEVHHRTYERLGTEEEGDLTVLCDTCHTLFHEATKQPAPVATLGEAIRVVWDTVDAQYATEDGQRGISTGFLDLDNLTAGLHPGELTVVAGQTGVGKSTLLSELARRAAVEKGKKPLLINLESQISDVAERLLSAQAQIDGHKIRKGRLSSDDIQRLLDAGDILRHGPLFISDPARLTLVQLVATVAKYRRERDIELLLLDSLDAIEPGNPRDLRHDQILAISRRLKALARELGIPIVVAARLTKPSERQDHKPRLADLGQSWPLQHEADNLWLLHRPGLYDREDFGDDKRIDILVSKQRKGPTGEVGLTFLKQFSRLEQYTPDDWSAPQ